MNLRRELSKEVQSRLAAGESKADIYKALSGRFRAGAVERSLAQWPLAAAKKQYRQQNVPLVIIAVFFLLLKLLQLAAVFQTLEPEKLVFAIPLAALPFIIYSYVIYGVKNCNLIGYILLILMSIRNLLLITQVDISNPQNMMLFAMSAAAIVLAILQKRRLFPNTSWLLRHQKDSSGHLVF